MVYLVGLGAGEVDDDGGLVVVRVGDVDVRNAMKFVYENVCVCVCVSYPPLWKGTPSHIATSSRNTLILFIFQHTHTHTHTHTSYCVKSIRVCECECECESVCAWDPRLYCHLCLFIYRCMQTHFSLLLKFTHHKKAFINITCKNGQTCRERVYRDRGRIQNVSRLCTIRFFLSLNLAHKHINLPFAIANSWRDPKKGI